MTIFFAIHSFFRIVNDGSYEGRFILRFIFVVYFGSFGEIQVSDRSDYLKCDVMQFVKYVLMF